MKKTIVLLVLLALLLPAGAALAEAPDLVEELPVLGKAAETEEPGLVEEPLFPDETEGERAEWTVMIYLCGSDLESRGGLATENLKEIASTIPDGRVNLVIQTGGTETWHTEEELGFAVASDRLQRWVYDENGFTLMDEQENASMARFTTLSSFIRWAAENYPAKKTMLSLWDHGGGSADGLIRDELYDGAVMSLEALERGVKNAGVRFDLVMADAGLMASLETCQALAPWAELLAASEESMPDRGFGCAQWLQSLYDDPGCGPDRLGKLICNTAQEMYAENGDVLGEKSLTLSVIELGRIAEVADAFNAYMAELVGLLGDPAAFGDYIRAVGGCDRFEVSEMWDLYDMARRGMKAGITKETANRLETLVDEAVLCNVRGSAHPYSHGISVYMPLSGENSRLDRFARACKNPWQLAFFDALNPCWDSPEWVGDTVGEIPAFRAESGRVTYDTAPSEDRTTALLRIHDGPDSGLDIRYDLQRYDEAQDQWLDLGARDEVTAVRGEDGDEAFAAVFSGKWLALQGEPLYLEPGRAARSSALLESPVLMDGGIGMLRILAEREIAQWGEDVPRQTTYRMIGFRDGFDSAAGPAPRNTRPLAELRNMEMSVCRPVYSSFLGKTGDMRYGEGMTVTPELRVEERALPAGQYRICFVITDMLDRSFRTDFMNLSWDGERAAFEGPETEEPESLEEAEAEERSARSDGEDRPDGIGLAYALLPELTGLETQGELAVSVDGLVCAEPEAHMLSILYLAAPAEEPEGMPVPDAEEAALEDRQTTLGELLVTSGSLRETLKETGLEPDAAVKLGSADGRDLYFLSTLDEDFLTRVDSQYADELTRLRQQLPELLRGAELFSPDMSAAGGGRAA